MNSNKIIVLIFFFPILLFSQQVNFLEIYKNLELFKAEKTNSNNVRELVNNISMLFKGFVEDWKSHDRIKDSPGETYLFCKYYGDASK